MSNTYPEIIGIGSTVYDTLMVVDRYPTEDTKLEDLETKVQGGGPCATALVAARKLGVSAAQIIGLDKWGCGVDAASVADASDMLVGPINSMGDDRGGSRVVVR